MTPNVTNTVYDADGQRTSMTDGTGTSVYVFDSLHRMTSSTNGAGATVGYGYDLKSNTTSIVYPGTTGTVTRSYDAADRLHTVTDWSANTTTFNYDADSNMTSEVYPNTTTASFTSDAADRLTAISDAPTASPSTPFASFTYGRDAANQVSSVTSTGVPADTNSYSYSQINQLKAVNAGAYNYDAAGNPVQLTSGAVQTFDAANQLTASSTISFVGTSSAGDSGTTSSLTISLPTPTVANDQILLSTTLPSSGSVTTPTGYAAVGTYTSGSSPASAKTAVFRRTAVTGDAQVTVTYDGTYPKAATVAAYRGVNPTSPIDATSNGSASAATTVTAPSVTPTVAGDQLVFLAGAENAAGAGTWTTPTSMTQRVAQAGGSWLADAVADRSLVSSAALDLRLPRSPRPPR